MAFTSVGASDQRGLSQRFSMTEPFARWEPLQTCCAHNGQIVVCASRRVFFFDIPKSSSKDVHFRRKTYFHKPSGKHATPFVPSASGIWNLGLPNVTNIADDWVTNEGTSESITSLHCLVDKCRGLREVRNLHCFIAKSGLELEPSLRFRLIDLYSACGNLDEGITLFLRLLPMELESDWKAIIEGCFKLEQKEWAIKLFYEALMSSCDWMDFLPDVILLVVKACTTLAFLRDGLLIHSLVIECNHELHSHINSALIGMYCACGCLHEARWVFDSLPKRNGPNFIAMIGGYSQLGCRENALQVFHQMQHECIIPTTPTFVSLIKVCSLSGDLTQGMMFHAYVIETGHFRECSVSNALIYLYVKCGTLEEAQCIFDRMENRSVITWNTLIGGYSQHTDLSVPLGLFQAMQQSGFHPTVTTFLPLLGACTDEECLNTGKELHACLIESGLDSIVRLCNTLTAMYIHCQSCEDAWAVFNKFSRKDVVSWNVMITGYTDLGYGSEAISLFEEMQQQKFKPDRFTFASTLRACSSIASWDQGRKIHSLVVEMGLESNEVIGNTLIDMYIRCGSLHDARVVFDCMSNSNIVTWNIMIGGYAEHGDGHVALQLFSRLQQELVKPDRITYITLMKACSSIAALEWGKRVHDMVREEPGLSMDISINNALIDMYAKCGSLRDAQFVFDGMKNRNVITWTAMISGFADHNDYDGAVHLFDCMKNAGIKPDGVAFLSLLSACAHEGRIEEGCFFFKAMRHAHGIVHLLEHYGCMVDLLGHAGLLHEAEDLLEVIPFGSNLVCWLSLLDACKLHKNLLIARYCFKNVEAQERGHPAAYMLMSTIYIDVGFHAEAAELEQERRSKDLWKRVGEAFIETGGHIHRFRADDKTHPQTNAVVDKLEMLSSKADAQGLLTSVSLQYEDFVCGHSEKLAVAFGLVNAPEKQTIRVAKNLRVCTQCHQVLKVISQLERRELVVKDLYCVHHFRDGLCSCKDYHYLANGT